MYNYTKTGELVRTRLVLKGGASSRLHNIVHPPSCPPALPLLPACPHLLTAAEAALKAGMPEGRAKGCDPLAHTVTGGGQASVAVPLPAWLPHKAKHSPPQLTPNVEGV